MCICNDDELGFSVFLQNLDFEIPHIFERTQASQVLLISAPGIQNLVSLLDPFIHYIFVK